MKRYTLLWVMLIFVTTVTACDDDASSNITNNDVHLGDGGPGEPCLRDTDCDSGFCMDEVTQGLPGGYCAAACSEPGGCEEGSICVDLSGFGTKGRCLKSCTPEEGSCRQGYLCFVVEDNQGVCYGECDDSSQCLTTGICDSSTGMCATWPEVCGNDEDDDLDGDADCADSECTGDINCGCPEDILENPASERAHEISLASLPAPPLSGHICGPSYEDWFIFQATETTTLSVSLDFQHAAGDLDLYVLDSSLRELAHSFSTDDNEALVLAVVAGESYYIRVEIFERGDNAYVLSLDHGPPSLSAAIEPSPLMASPGDSVTLTVTLTNLGGTEAVNVVGSLITAEPDVLVTGATASWGTIPPSGGFATDTTSLSFTIDSGHTNNKALTLALELHDDASNTWVIPLSVEVPSPHLTYTDAVLVDSGGDGVMDPGEIVTFSFGIRNTGDATSGAVLAAQVSMDAASEAEGIAITAPTSQICSTAPLSTGEQASCEEWTLTIPGSVSTGHLIVLTIALTDDSGTEWEYLRTIPVGDLPYQSLLADPDAAGDNASSYLCDLKDLQAFVMGGTLHVRTTFHGTCPLSGLHDLYISVGGASICLSLENNIITLWSSLDNWSIPRDNPGSYGVAPRTGDTALVEYEIDLVDVPDLDLAPRVLTLSAAVAAQLPAPNTEYADYAPDMGVTARLTW